MRKDALVVGVLLNKVVQAQHVVLLRLVRCAIDRGVGCPGGHFGRKVPRRREIKVTLYIDFERVGEFWR